jgi:hypothetical protein
METIKPTLDQIWEEELGDPVFSESDPSWRHGETRTEVYKRESDATFWMVHYRVSGDGEYNELREERDCMKEPCQVFPHEVITTVYK